MHRSWFGHRSAKQFVHVVFDQYWSRTSVHCTVAAVFLHILDCLGSDIMKDVSGQSINIINCVIYLIKWVFKTF